MSAPIAVKLVGQAAINRKLDALRRSIARAEANGSVTMPPVMASPPTVTGGVLNAASTINGNGVTAPSVLATDTRLFYAGSVPIAANLVASHPGSSSAARIAGSVNYGDTTRSGNLLEVYFKTDAPVLEVGQRLFSAKFNIWVDIGDGKGMLPAFAADFDAAVSGGTGAAHAFTKIDFGSRAWRRIRLVLPASNDFTGINFSASDTLIASAPQDQFRLMIFGDSWVEGIGRGRIDGGFPTVLARMLGFENYLMSGVGGTGVLTPNTGVSPNRPRWLDRLVDITDFAPDFVIIPASINDNGNAAGNSGIATAFGQMLTTLQGALPDTVFFITSPSNPSGNFPSDATQKAWLAGATAVADAKRSFIVDTWSPVAPFSGTGSTGALTGTGNQDFYIGNTSGTDKSHLSAAGNAFYADFMAGKIKAKLRTLP